MFKKISKNIISSWLLQMIGYVIPLLMLPYLIRIVGSDKYGMLNFSQSVIQYFIILVAFGFDLSIISKVSIARNDAQKLENIFLKTIYSRLLLLSISTFLFVIVAFFLKNKVNYVLLYSTFLIVLGNALTPNWFFQGLEKFRFILLINLSSKILLGLLVFTLVSTPQDYWKFNLSLSLTQCITGLIMIYVVFKQYDIRIKSIPFSDLILHIKDNFHFFYGSFLIAFYVNTNIIILGYLIDFKELGYFLAAYKLINIFFSTAIIPISQALFPALAFSLKSNLEETIYVFKNIIVPSLFYFIIFCCGVIYFISDNLILLLFGDLFIKSGLLLKIMIFSTLGISLNNIILSPLMVTLGLKKEYSKVLLIAAIFSIIITTIISFFWGSIGASISWMLTELFIPAYSIFKLNKINLKIISFKAFAPIQLINLIKEYIYQNKVRRVI